MQHHPNDFALYKLHQYSLWEHDTDCRFKIHESCVKMSDNRYNVFSGIVYHMHKDSVVGGNRDVKLRYMNKLLETL